MTSSSWGKKRILLMVMVRNSVGAGLRKENTTAQGSTLEECDDLVDLWALLLESASFELHTYSVGVKGHATMNIWSL